MNHSFEFQWRLLRCWFSFGWIDANTEWISFLTELPFGAVCYYLISYNSIVSHFPQQFSNRLLASKSWADWSIGEFTRRNHQNGHSRRYEALSSWRSINAIISFIFLSSSIISLFFSFFPSQLMRRCRRRHKIKQNNNKNVIIPLNFSYWNPFSEWYKLWKRNAKQ